jgi:hypothetical protein
MRLSSAGVYSRNPTNNIRNLTNNIGNFLGGWPVWMVEIENSAKT